MYLIDEDALGGLFGAAQLTIPLGIHIKKFLNGTKVCDRKEQGGLPPISCKNSPQNNITPLP